VDATSEWKVQSLEGFDMANTRARGQFCTKPVNDALFENEGKSGIVPTPGGTLDKDNKQFSFEWTRPFDVEIDYGLSLVGGYDFMIYLTWVVTEGENYMPTGRNRIYQYGNALKEDG
jgi:hypothetical protein